MGDKSEQKIQHILQTAREVFIEKGYKDVTMKDIVEACDISRGGLYLYFSGTQELFLEVLKMESEETDDVFSGTIGEEAAASDILALFLKEQKKEILRKKNNLTRAMYEFFFSHKVPKKENLFKSQFDEAVTIIEQLLSTGALMGEFYCPDPLGAARNIMYVLEGLKVSSLTRGITEEMIDSELLYIMQGLVAEDSE